MQNKTKLFLMMVMVFGFGFLMSGKVLAAGCADLVEGASCTTTDGKSGTCKGGSCSAPTSSECCCEDTVKKSCTKIDCTETCASLKKIDGACSAMSDYATRCAGTTSSTDKCTSGTCQLATSCKSAGVGTCKDTKNKCCLDSGGGGGGGDLDIPDVGLPTNSGLVKGILENLVNWLLSIVGIIAIIGFIISGFQYFLVATDEKMVEKAKKTMVASIIGLVVALSGFIAIKAVDLLLRGTL